MRSIPVSEIEALLEGQIDVRRRPGAVQPLRLPFAEAGFYDPFNRWVASTAAGVRLRFRSDTQAVRLTATQHLASTAVGAERRGAYDLYLDGKFFARGFGQGGALMAPSGGLTGDPAITVDFEGLAAGDKLIELWLPQAATVSITGLSIDDGASLAPAPDTRARVIFHGSSITHDMEAEGATATWPAVASNLAGVNHLNLGWGGSCLLSGLAARIIRDQPADAIVLKLGINVHPEGQMKERAFTDSAHAMISIIREHHAKIPMVVISPIFSAARDEAGSAGGPVAGPDAGNPGRGGGGACRRRGRGDQYFSEGWSCFRRRMRICCQDDLHPNTEGYRLMGEGRQFLLREGAGVLVQAPLFSVTTLRAART